MKGQKLFLASLLSCCCTLAYAQQSSKAVCDKEIEPGQSPNAEAVIPSLADDATGSGGDGTTNPSTTPANPSGDKEYVPSSKSPGAPKSDKEYFPAP